MVVGRTGKRGSTRPRPSAISRSSASLIASRRKAAKDRYRLALRRSSPRCLPRRGSATDSWPTWRSGRIARRRISGSSTRRVTTVVGRQPRPGPTSTVARRPTSWRDTIRICSRRSRGCRTAIGSRSSCRLPPMDTCRSSVAMNRSTRSSSPASRATADASGDVPAGSGFRSAPTARVTAGPVPGGGPGPGRVTDRHLPVREKAPYDPDAAKERADAHADHFASLVLETLHEHQEATGRTGVVVAPFDTELFGHWWFEGPTWLEAVLRKLEGHVDAVTASDFLAAHPPRSTIQIPEGSWGQGGHHYVWLNDGTRWIWEEVYRAEDGLIDALHATRSRKDPTVRRIVAQLARELLLLEASDWPFLVTTVAAKDYAEARVREHVKAFDRLRTMLERAKEGTLAPDDAAWLAAIEERDSPFPDLDLESWTLEP